MDQHGLNTNGEGLRQSLIQNGAQSRGPGLFAKGTLAALFSAGVLPASPGASGRTEVIFTSEGASVFSKNHNLNKAARTRK